MRLILIAALLGAMVGRAAVTHAEPATPEKTKRDLSQLREARGEVQDVDKNLKRVTLGETKGSPLILQLDGSTTIFIEGRAGTLDEIKPGIEVRASYELKQGANLVQWLEINKNARKSPAEPPNKDQPKEQGPTNKAVPTGE